jgi:hypothetical protein
MKKQIIVLALAITGISVIAQVGGTMSGEAGVSKDPNPARILTNNNNTVQNNVPTNTDLSTNMPPATNNLVGGVAGTNSWSTNSVSDSTTSLSDTNTTPHYHWYQWHYWFH